MHEKLCARCESRLSIDSLIVGACVANQIASLPKVSHWIMLMHDNCGQTEARVSTIMDYRAPFDQGL